MPAASRRLKTTRPSRSSLASLYPDIAAQWHPTANAPLTLADVTPGMRRSAVWICPADPSHVWEAPINRRVYRKSGCPWCSGRRLQPERSLLARFPEIAKEWHPTRNGALGPGDVGFGATRTVWWRCGRHRLHVYQASPNKRTSGRGRGCPICAGRLTIWQTSLGARFPRVAEEWHPTKNGRLGPADVVPGSDRKVWWRCLRDPSHEWRAVVRARTREGDPTGCPACAGRVPTPATSLAATFPAVAKEWHPTRNRTLRPGDVTPSSDRKVWWQCRKDATHEWRATIGSRTGARPSGCPLCANRRVSATNSLSARFPAIAAEWHPTRNGRLRPDRLIAGTDRKVWWQCRTNPAHAWSTSVNLRTSSGHGCPMCAGRVVTEDNCLLAKRPELARQWHPTRNGALTPAGVTPGSHKKVWWRCPLNPAHEWCALVNSRSRHGCPDCAREGNVRRSRRGTERATPDPALRLR